MKGMGAKKEALILKALEDQRRFVGRRLTAEAHDTAAGLVAALREHAPDAEIYDGRQPAPRLRDLRRSRHPRRGGARRR